MDIQLNINNNVVADRSKIKKTLLVKKPKIIAKKSSKNHAPAGFSFDSQPSKVKAIVARRRPQKTNEPTKSSPLETPPRRPMVLRPPDTTAEDKQHTQGELMLNIVSGVPKPKPQQNKSKSSRFDRKSKKENYKKDNHKNDNNKINPFTKRVLSNKEIDDGIRKFSQNPNKRQTNDNKDDDKSQQNGNSKPVKKVFRPSDRAVSKIKLFTNNPETKVLGQRLVKPLTEKIFTGTPVSSIDLHPHCIKNLADILNITELTTVQQKTIPEAIKGKDVLVRSQTGSGKTLAYALPVVQKLQEIRPKITRDDGILAVIIVPTRELAMQTYELFVKLLKPFTWIVPGILIGGERRKAEKARLRKGINILVGTPGRLVDHLLHTESFKLDKSKFFVLDEADRLLEMGYERDVKQIVDAIDEQRQKAAAEGKKLDNLQRMLLSATLTSAVQKLAGLTLKEPLFIDNKDEDPATTVQKMIGGEMPDVDEEGALVIPENLQMSFVVAPTKLRLVTLSGLLAKELQKKNFKAMVFMSTMEMVNFHHDLMNEQLTQKVLDDEDEPNEDEDDGDEPLLKGMRFFKLHGSMTQNERQGVFNAFRDAKAGVLLATDVAGRGLDVPEVNLVIQYSPPQKVSDFVHRVGRTARAGKSGRAILFLTPSETNFIRFLEDKRIRISQVDMDVYLNALVEADSEARNIQEAASNLQHKFQELLADDKEMHDKACKAFVSWMKFYSTFPKQLKPIFNIKVAHMGHFAKSFGLKDEPTSFTKKHATPKAPPPTNRLTYTERNPEKLKEEKKTRKRLYATTVTGPMPNRLNKFATNSRTLTTSEYGSGLPEIKRKK
ncbi:probable ATP-dependent RNA helicase CG8611 [Episyrphus balteatus]|uniref:probable ATP-dependent RNA helicase CG8611 n=1 Tax=Episyrphus balteatus TaxID=286459 RepID=UPI002486B51A|nr:probable ATP-dependent RNA helicase CG8611 [Episyrphus balteatus]